MKALFATLSDEDLTAIEDDLNFCRFTGLPSDRIQRMMTRVKTLPMADAASMQATAAA